jgi:serine protease Do
LKDFAVPEGRGALIGGVVDGGSAAEAGLRSGDVIVEVDGKPVLDSRGLKLMVGQNAPGKKLEIKIWREGKFKSLSVTLKEMPDSEPVSDLNSAESEGAEATGLSGIDLTDIDDEARRKFALPAVLGGALVAAIDEDSVAFEAGLRDGDVIQEINHKSIATAKEAMAAAYGMKGKRLMLRVWSRGSSHFLVVDESPKR